MPADALAEFDRQGRRDGDGARNVAVIVGDRDGSIGLERTSDHIAAVEGAHVVDDAADLAGLGTEHVLGEEPQVQPDRHRQSQEAENDRGEKERTHDPLLRHPPLT
jgi:hypothetical protein